MTLESIWKLRTCARNMAKGRNLEKHEDCNLLLIIADEIEAEIAEKYMELPVDADGVPIHPGNRVEMDGKGGEVWLVGTTDVMCNDGMSYRAVAVNHAKPDPLKELLSELANEVWEASCTCQTTWSDSGLDGIEERYAERIRELMEVDA